jgi:hypothetical protein
MLKKLFLPLLIIGTLFVPIVGGAPVYAEGEDQQPVQSKIGDRRFLGLTTWDNGIEHYLDGGEIDGENDLPVIIAVIAGNIFNDILVVATYLILGYIIYGGYLYIFANGETNKIAIAKKALNQAFIGLAITMSSNIIVNSIRIAFLGNANNNLTNVQNVDVTSMVSNLIGWVIGVGGITAAAFVVGGGILYMTSSGDSAKVQTAKNTIKYALIGLVIVAFAQAISMLMTNIIKGN